MSSAVEYRDPAGGRWRVSEVARLNLVSPAIDGPNVFLVLRFEREGEERFVRWLGDPAWREPRTLGRLFELAARPMPQQDDGTGVGPAPPETVALWVKIVASMGPDELDSFEERTFRQWDPASLGALRSAIERRRGELSR